VVAETKRSYRVRKNKEKKTFTSSSLLRLIVLSLSVSAVEDWVEALCGA